MDRLAYARHVAALPVGKKLPDGTYLHVSTLAGLPTVLVKAVEEARALARVSDVAVDVVRFAGKGLKLSLLSYPGFFDEAFPALSSSHVVDLASRTVTLRTYKTDGNPPILHRKELLLPPGHPRAEEFARLTAAAESVGLFSDSKVIGTRRAWEAKIARLGLRVDGHALVEAAREAREVVATADVQRHRTALQRYSMSAPMQALWRHGFIQGSSVFDYGCGRGDDLRILKELSIDAAGWDPHFASDGAKREADVVNLGYVINVIEDLAERKTALTGAYKLARRVLSVAALIGGRTAFEQHRLFRDGVLTSRGTFQKYFTQQELREYIEASLGRQPVAIAPGLFFVFCTDEEEQRFLAARQTQARCQLALAKPERPAVTRAPRAPSRWEQHRELLDEYWERCIGLGRLPKDHEFARAPELRGSVGTPQTVLRKLVEERGSEALDAGRAARMDDLRVYLALNLFERRRSIGHLPNDLQIDIAAFWGSYAAAKADATALLFSIGKPEVIREACERAAARRLGYLDEGHDLQLQATLVAALPAALRVYVGAAARLYGEVESADVVKIHIHSGKLTLLMYDDFESKPLPRLIERVKVNMRSQEVAFFEYGDDQPVQLLYHKSRYVTDAYPHYAEQVAFERALAEAGVDTSGFGPPGDALTAYLRDSCGLHVSGFELRHELGKAP